MSQTRSCEVTYTVSMLINVSSSLTGPGNAEMGKNSPHYEPAQLQCLCAAGIAPVLIF